MGDCEPPTSQRGGSGLAFQALPLHALRGNLGEAPRGESQRSGGVRAAGDAEGLRLQPPSWRPGDRPRPRSRPAAPSIPGCPRRGPRPPVRQPRAGLAPTCGGAARLWPAPAGSPLEAVRRRGRRASAPAARPSPGPLHVAAPRSPPGCGHRPGPGRVRSASLGLRPAPIGPQTPALCGPHRARESVCVSVCVQTTREREAERQMMKLVRNEKHV